MSANPSGQYFVRVRGRVQGPFELSRLKILRTRGQFSRVFEVSEDGHTWVSSDSLAELLDPAPAVVPAPDAEPQRVSPAAGFAPPAPVDDPWNDAWEPRRQKPESNLGTILLIVALIIVPAGIVGGVLLFERLNRDRIAGNSTDDVAPEPDNHEASTFQYWSSFKASRDRVRFTDDTSTTQVATQLRTTAGEMSSLPTLGVDVEAVRLVLDYSVALKSVAQTIEQSNNPETYLEAFLRGAEGDPFGKALELKNSKDEALRQLADVEHRSDRLRATLTASYGRQFP